MDANAPVLGQPLMVDIRSEFPNAHGFLFVSLPPVTPTTILPGCVSYLDLNSLVLAAEYFTDASGNYSAALPQPNTPSAAGVEIVIQTRIWFANAFGDDHASNAIALRAGCVPPGGQGCTPGYWKQPHHFDDWSPMYTPNTLFSDVFEDAFPGKTLLQVLSQGGGGLNALGRHTVAALLNAASGEVSYDMGFFEVIDAFNDLFPSSKPNYNALKDQFEAFNQQGCNL